jgi:hypothetical protein
MLIYQNLKPKFLFTLAKMEVANRAQDLLHLIQLAKEHPKLQIFVDEPPICLEPWNSTYTTTFIDPELVQLFKENYRDKNG